MAGACGEGVGEVVEGEEGGEEMGGPAGAEDEDVEGWLFWGRGGLGGGGKIDEFGHCCGEGGRMRGFGRGGEMEECLVGFKS